MATPKTRMLVEGNTAVIEDSAGTATEESATPPVRGRKRDHGRDAAILEAALDVLAESGYEGMTMDMVAQRAKAGKATVYRRWQSKPALVLDAVTYMKRTLAEASGLPDTGTLRGDMLALFKPQTSQETERKLRVMAGLASMLTHHPDFSEASNSAVVEPWVSTNLVLMKRALSRGELREGADLDAASQVVPSMAAYRTLVLRQPFDLKFLTSIVDGVLLPALLKRGAQP